MKHSQLMQAWSMRSITHGDGRRLITVWRGEEPVGLHAPAAADRNATRPRRGRPLAVKFQKDGSCDFTPVVRRGSALPAPIPTAYKAQLPETV